MLKLIIINYKAVKKRVMFHVSLYFAVFPVKKSPSLWLHTRTPTFLFRGLVNQGSSERLCLSLYAD